MTTREITDKTEIHNHGYLHGASKNSRQIEASQMGEILFPENSIQCMQI